MTIIPEKDHPPEESYIKRPRITKKEKQEREERIIRAQGSNLWEENAEMARSLLEYERTRQMLPSNIN